MTTNNTSPTVAQKAQLDTVRDEVTRSLLLAMHAHGLGEGRTTEEMEERARLIVSAACETAPTKAVVLIEGSDHDARRLATAVLIGVDPLLLPTAGDLEEAANVIARMVEARHRD
jgi:hypothetical protein